MILWPITSVSYLPKISSLFPEWEWQYTSHEAAESIKMSMAVFALLVAVAKIQGLCIQHLLYTIYYVRASHESCYKILTKIL